MLTRAQRRAIPAVRPRPGPRLEAVLGLLAAPLAMLLGIVVAIGRLARRARPLAPAPRLELAPRGERLRDVAEYAARVEAEECPTRRGFGSLDFQLAYAGDFVPSALDAYPRLANRFFSCPPPFRRVTVESLDGTPIAAEVAVRDDRPRPGLVVAHGVFGSSGQRIYSTPAVRAFSEWGFNVAVVDLRGWGRSAALSDAPISGGWREAGDVLGAARHLLENSPTSTVGAMGYSLGGTSVLLAAADDRAPELLASGVFSESGFSNARDVLHIADTNPGLLSREYVVYWIFRLGFGTRLRSAGAPGMTVPDYLERVSAPYYGVRPDELYDLDSVVKRVDRIRVPAFHLHAVDDWVVHVDQAVALRDAADEAGNRLVGVCIRDRGAHCAFGRVAGEWRNRVARDYFAATSGVELR